MMFQRWVSKTTLGLMAASAFALVALPEATQACCHKHSHGCGGGGCYGGGYGGCHGGWGGCHGGGYGGCYGGCGGSGYHAGYWGGSGGGYATYSSPYNASPIYAQSVPANGVEIRSSLYGPNTADAIVSSEGDFELKAPEGAQIWINDTSVGSNRRFTLPKEVSTQASVNYEVRANWMENGRQVTRSKQITVRPNQRQVIDLSAEAKQNSPAKSSPKP
jgi:uncharacterized protein (TIGR03000 family)